MKIVQHWNGLLVMTVLMSSRFGWEIFLLLLWHYFWQQEQNSRRGDAALGYEKSWKLSKSLHQQP